MFYCLQRPLQLHEAHQHQMKGRMNTYICTYTCDFFYWDGTGKFVSIVRRKSGQQKFFKFNIKLFSYKINNI